MAGLLELDKRHIYQQKNTWVTFNVTSAFTNECHGKLRDVVRLVISIRATTSRDEQPGQLDLALMSPHSRTRSSADLQPLLLLSYSTAKAGTTSSRSRTKRSPHSEDYEEETNNIWDDELLTGVAARKAKRYRNSCRRRPLYVDFSDIHYDSWIVAPNGYEAFQCQGKCFFPVSEHLSPTKHAIVQTLLHSVAPSKAPRACCVPTRLEPISVLYVDQRGVLTYRFSYQDMVVAECGCR